MGSDYRYYGYRDTKPPIDELRTKKMVAVDIETYTADDPVQVGIGIAWTATDAVYFSLLPPSDDIPWDILRDPTVTKIYHNAPYDLRHLREWGVDTTNVIDTAVMARMAVIPANLEDACEAVQTLSRPRHMKDVWAELGVSNSIDMPEEDCAIKCCVDCLGTYQLYLELEPQVDMDYVRQEMELLPILETMSTRGIALDQEVRQALEFLYTHELGQLDELCMEQFGFNPGSPPQVAYILSKRGNFLPARRAQKSRRWSLSTEESTLEKILHVEPLAGLVLRRRHVSKMLGTYIRPYRGQERAYTYFHLDAATARISSSNSHVGVERNLQNIPGQDPTSSTRQVFSMRNMFLPDNGYFTDTDFSQIELRVLAYLSDDRVMQDILNDPDGDLHQETANFLSVPRKIAKNCTFAIVYGATAQTVMETAHLSNLNLAQSMLNQIFRKYPRMGDWIRSTQEFGRNHGYVYSMGGRKISVIRAEEEITEEDDLRTIERKLASQDRKSCNYPIQMSAGEVQKEALRLSQREIVEKLHIPMAHQVHDEIIWDGVFWSQDEINDLFNGKVAPFPTPTKTKFIERWE